MLGKLKLFILFAVAFFSFEALYAQEKKEAQDSLVRLVEAASAQLQEINGVSYRKVIGPARFLHNNTYLLCDTALWNVNTNVINAIGNVQIIQDNTFLTSDKIDYIVDENLAQFRGTLVELFDKEGNVLRTKYLDYNTKDSIATFFSGGAMRNPDGNLIESRNGEYRSADKMFSFIGDVQMFTDSVFIKSKRVDYNTVTNKAYFRTATTAWQEENMLFANDGEFDRPNDVFHFNKDSYILTNEQEIWADTLTYNRVTGVAELYDNIQILDTVQKAYCFADEAVYIPQPFRVELTRKPSVAMYTEENGVRDTVFMAADTLKYYTIPYCDIDSLVIVNAKERKMLSDLDPLAQIEETAAKRRAKNEEAAKNPLKVEKPKNKQEELEEFAESRKEKLSGEKPVAAIGENGITPDSLSASGALVAVADSTAVEPVKDTTAVAFIDAWNNVRVYRSDLQALCDSLVYTGVDSIARMYINPVMWNEGKHQFTADSMQLVMKDNVLDKANLITNAFVASQEDSVHFNQIKGAEMVAYFKDNDVYRYDALGGASMIFYLQEDSVITMMNQKEGKILSARIKDRQIQRIKYIENLQNDVLPVYNLPIDDQRLKGFNWRGDERPLNRYEVTAREIEKSQRKHFKAVPFPTYPFAKVYFEDTRDAIIKYKVQSDSLRAAAEFERAMANQQEQQRKEALERERSAAIQDSLMAVTADSLSAAISVPDSLETHQKDDLQKKNGSELSEVYEMLSGYRKQENEYTAVIDSLTAKIISREQLSALPKSERKSVRKEQSIIKKELKRTRRQLAIVRKKISRIQ